MICRFAILVFQLLSGAKLALMEKIREEFCAFISLIKLEIESFTLPENSIEEQNFIVAIQEYLMQSLEIPYQVVAICTGDMGGPDARQIDIEAWMPSQNRYRETHTSDLMTDYQARGLNTKVKLAGKSEFVHMNDATVFAISRTPIAILENYQQKDGSILVPKVLQKYLNFKKIG